MTSKKSKNGLAHLMTGPVGLGALMFATYVGPGFASGTQTTSYMLTKGWIGVFLGPTVVGILAFVWCCLVNEFNRLYRPKNYREQSDMIYHNPVMRTAMGVFVDIVGVLQILLVTASMVSGAANLFNQMWGIPMAVGTLIFSAVILLLTLSGTGLVLKVGSVLTCCILLVTVYIGAVGIGVAWPATQAWLAQRIPPSAYGFTTFGAWYTIVTFVNNFISGRNAAVPASLESLQTRKDSIVASLVNALLCVLSTMVYTVIFAAGMPDILSESIPTLYALREIIGASKGSQAVYVIIALAAMLSTGVSLMYGAIARFHDIVKGVWKTGSEPAINAFIVVVFIVLSTALSTFGILAIIGIGYTYLGYVSVPLMVFLWFFTIPYRMYKDKKDGCLPNGELSQE